MPGAYVPPHLRGRGGSSNSNSNSNNVNSNASRSNSSSNTSSTRSNAGSRWNNLDSRSDNNRNGNRYGGRTGSYDDNGAGNNRRSGNHASVSTGGGKSRWANVDRSAIASGSHSSSRYGNNNNNNYNNRRFNYSQDNHQKFAHVKAIFFGDSFIKLFGLLNDYSDSVLKAPQKIEVQKYKAASAKGLCRDGNENRSKILKTVETVRRQNELRNNKNYQNLERLVFCFGSVDVHMSYYFKKYVQQQPLSDDDLREIATNYVDFVAGLETTNDSDTTRKPLTKLIVGIYPSPLCDKDVGASLLAYGSLENEDQVSAVNDSDDKHIELRQARVDLFNQALRERCDFHNNHEGQSNGILEYWDVRDELLTQDETSERPKVKDAYKDVSDLNIHLIHETVLQLWVQKWPWYEALTTTSGSNRGQGNTSFLEYLQETFDEYRKTKPWAERTHVAETMGIQLA